MEGLGGEVVVDGNGDEFEAEDDCEVDDDIAFFYFDIEGLSMLSFGSSLAVHGCTRADDRRQAEKRETGNGYLLYDAFLIANGQVETSTYWYMNST